MTTTVAPHSVDEAFFNLVQGIEELEGLSAPDAESDAWHGFTFGAALAAATWAGYVFIVT
jgi:hypothetical protein